MSALNSSAETLAPPERAVRRKASPLGTISEVIAPPRRVSVYRTGSWTICIFLASGVVEGRHAALLRTHCDRGGRPPFVSPCSGGRSSVLRLPFPSLHDCEEEIGVRPKTGAGCFFDRKPRSNRNLRAPASGRIFLTASVIASAPDRRARQTSPSTVGAIPPRRPRASGAGAAALRRAASRADPGGSIPRDGGAWPRTRATKIVPANAAAAPAPPAAR